MQSDEEAYRLFVSQVRQNLHVIFTMNPSSPDFHNRALTSPALFNRCTIDWFGDWSDSYAPFFLSFVSLFLTVFIPGRFTKSARTSRRTSTSR